MGAALPTFPDNSQKNQLPGVPIRQDNDEVTTVIVYTKRLFDLPLRMFALVDYNGSGRDGDEILEKDEIMICRVSYRNMLRGDLVLKQRQPRIN